jgi:hypothetical protein
MNPLKRERKKEQKKHWKKGTVNNSIDAPNPEDVCGSSWILALLFQFCL